MAWAKMVNIVTSIFETNPKFHAILIRSVHYFFCNSAQIRARFNDPQCCFDFTTSVNLEYYGKYYYDFKSHIVHEINCVLTHLFFRFVLGSMNVGQRTRAQNRAHRGGPLYCYEPMLAEQNVSDIIGSGYADRGVPKEVCAVNVAIFLALHPQKLPSLVKI